MDFSSDANANFEGLLAVNREICMTQMAEKTSPDAPPSCAVVPKKKQLHNAQTGRNSRMNSFMIQDSARCVNAFGRKEHKKRRL